MLIASGCPFCLKISVTAMLVGLLSFRPSSTGKILDGKYKLISVLLIDLWSVIIGMGIKSRLVSMDNNANRNWSVLNWNVRGLNSADKCNVIRSKIEESSCAVFCIQKTKKQHFEPSNIQKIAPKWFNKYSFVPSEGASGGLLVGWNSSIFIGEVLYSSKFAITIHLTTQHNVEKWKLITVYGPCQGRDRQDVMDWLNAVQINDDENWMCVGISTFIDL
jgi:hypothetical protein